MLDRLLPLAARHGVELRCCCDTGLVGYRAQAAQATAPEVRKVRRWGLKKEKKEEGEKGEKGDKEKVARQLLAAPLIPEARVGVFCTRQLG